MSGSYSTFCNEAMVDAAIWTNPFNPEKPAMCITITTDLGDHISVNFRNEASFAEFCKKHNFKIEDKRDAVK